MPIVNNVYVVPTGGWVNDTSPYINATEMNAISNTLQKVPIGNGGTNATTASAALSNLGGVPLTNVKSKGSATNPVYFNSSGVAVAMSGTLPVSLGGTGNTSASAERNRLGLGNTTGAIPIANGGTGATTASAALTNLGAEPKSNVVSKGSYNTPVYFDSSGVAKAITGALPISLGGSGMTGVTTSNASELLANLDSVYVAKWGKIVFVKIVTNKISASATCNGRLPSGYRPISIVHGIAPGVTQTAWGNGVPKNYAFAQIDTAGDINIVPMTGVSTQLWYIFCACYICS